MCLGPVQCIAGGVGVPMAWPYSLVALGSLDVGTLLLVKHWGVSVLQNGTAAGGSSGHWPGGVIKASRTNGRQEGRCS